MKRPEMKSNNITAKAKKKRNAEQTNSRSSSSSCLITKFFNYLQIVGVGVVLIVTCCCCCCGCWRCIMSILLVVVSVRVSFVCITLYIIIRHFWERHSCCRLNYSLPIRLYEFIVFTECKINSGSELIERNLQAFLFSFALIESRRTNDKFIWADVTTTLYGYVHMYSAPMHRSQPLMVI